MIQRGQQPGLAGEAGQPLGVRGEAIREDLDRHLAVEGRVDRFPDHTHPAFTDLLGQAVVEQLLSGLDGHFAIPLCRTKNRVYLVRTAVCWWAHQDSLLR